MNKALLIGYGSIGRRHFDILTNDFNFQVDLVTKQIIENYTFFTDICDVPNLESYSYYVISSPTCLHYQHLKYLNDRVHDKKIFIEKPIFDTFHDLVLKNTVFVGYSLRYSFVLDEIKKIIGRNKILFIQSYVGQYLPTWRKNIDYRDSYSASKSQGGGVLLDLSHELDYIQYLCGSIFELKSYNDRITDLEIDSDDIFTAIGKTITGTIINVTMDYISKQIMRYCIIHLMDRTIYADFINNVITVSDYSGNIYSVKSEKQIDNYSYYNMHLDILNSPSVEKVCSYEAALSVISLISNLRKE